MASEGKTANPRTETGKKPAEPKPQPSVPAADAKAPTKAAKAAPQPVAKKAAKKTPAPKAPKKAASVPPASPKAEKAAEPATKSKAQPKTQPKAPSKKPKPAKARPAPEETERILDSQVAYEGPLFRVLRDHIIEPGGQESHRDVIRHNGSVVILATNPGKRKKDPWIVIERQYRHAAGQFLWELPAGKLDAGEKPIDGAKRELAEETSYSAKKWSPLVEYFASPGFLGESMKVFLAEGLIAGDAHPEEDEHIDFRLVKLSELLAMVDKGKIIDGKTLTSILLYARMKGVSRKK